MASARLDAETHVEGVLNGSGVLAGLGSHVTVGVTAQWLRRGNRLGERLRTVSDARRGLEKPEVSRSRSGTVANLAQFDEPASVLAAGRSLLQSYAAGVVCSAHHLVGVAHEHW